MKEKWEKLFAVLQEMLNVYQTILRLSQQKKEILISAKSQELVKVTKQEEVLILQVGRLEELRGTLIREITAHHGIVEESLSLAQLQTIGTPEALEKLETFSKEFGKLMAEITPLNKLNTALITQALGFVNYNMNILSQTAVGPTYAPQGHANEQAPKRKVFDAKV